MKKLNYYKKIMQDKSKNLSFSDYLKYITSWQELSFYKINGLISRFPKTDRIAGIVKFKNFDDQIENSIKNAKSYDFSKSFFDNFEELWKNIKMPDMIQFLENENSQYSDVAVWCKKNYLSNVTTNSENILYSFSVKEARNVFNSVAIWKHSENEFDYNTFTGWTGKNVHLYSNMWCWMWNEHIYNSAHIPY